MTRIPMLKLLTLSMALALAVAGVAWAAASPAVTTGSASKRTDTSAVLSGTINPNGSATSYVFAYGPTTAYGATSPVRKLRSGTRPVSVTQTISGLTPGTTYHYRLLATNGAGQAAGADRALTTTGHPPATVLTGPPANVTSTTATPTGTVNPQGAVTSWGVQYGQTTAYGVETYLQPLPASTQPVPVSLQLTGLAPETLFHYRIVAFHGSVASYGQDQTFFTEPSRRLTPRLIAHTGPGHRRHAPYTFTTHGVIVGVGAIPPAQRCTGRVGIRYYNGRRQVAFVLGPVGPDCRFAIPATFRRLRGRGPAALTVKVWFRGNGYLAPAERIDHVAAG